MKPNSQPVIGDTGVTIFNPFTFPRKIWQLVEPYLTKYDVEDVEAYPTEQVIKNTIAWRVLNRVPGGGPSGNFHKRGPGYSRIVGTTPDGYVLVEYMQEYRILFEFGVFGISTVDVDDLAWDLEQAVLASETQLKKEDAGITLYFSEQVEDINLSQRHQNDLIARYLRFESTVPVRYIIPEVQLQGTIIKFYSGGVSVTNNFVTRTTDPTYIIPTDANEVVVGVYSITKYPANSSSLTPLLLKEGTDFRIKVDSNRVYTVIWDDSYGAPPQPGDQFVINYTKAGLMDLSNKSFT